MTLTIPFDNTYARLPGTLFTRQAPTPVPAPRLLAWNDALADQLGITGTPDAAVLAGNTISEGADPLAQAYAGHQFGGFSPSLGDGRAVLLGEVIDQTGQRRDIQLKGSGRTPWSRGGDGRAWMGPVLREYVVSEAMHAMGIPTTRALAATATGEDILRETPLPGAVLTRVAASHLRVGHFEYFAARGDTDSLQALFNYAVDRHDPGATDPLSFLKGVIARQARLVAQWMGVGFIHGVMNTDNTSISGETIDYGPCAFMDGYNPSTVFSSIDRNGRYAYDNQAKILPWNMAQLASALLALMPDPEAAIPPFTEAVHAMPDLIEAERLRTFAAKIGIASPRAGDTALIDDLLALMAAGRSDFTNTFRALPSNDAKDHVADRDAFLDWADRWHARLESEPDAAALMARTNPAVIPRNHRIEQMITAAVAGDMAPFQTLMTALATPYQYPVDQSLTRPPSQDEVVTATFCGT
ncbi:protein adenylyltransferase SelO [Pseudooceanicola onchidii]|uniref:protein adenylyltransferase SelO n=1 Tax=Pseudooceanicola onchidii TaxID=2562279 RepID=UPI0010AAA31B|nr:YdiU family protein [Pseudooceanicola onchidii]